MTDHWRAELLVIYMTIDQVEFICFRSHNSLLFSGNIRLDDNNELQYLQTSQARTLDWEMLRPCQFSFPLFRTIQFRNPSSTIGRSLMVGYGVPFAIVLIMGIGNELIIINFQNLNSFI